MSTGTRVIKNTGWLYGKLAITSIISLVTTRIILNSLGETDYGIYNLVGGVIGMLGFISAAMASTTQRFLNYSEGEGDVEKQKSIYNVSIILHAAIAGIMIVVLAVAGFIFFGGILDIPEGRTTAAKIVYVCLVFSTSVTIMSAPFDAVLTAHENMKYYALVSIIESLFKLAVALACLFSVHDKLIVYGVLMALIPLASISIMFTYCRKHYKECVFAPNRYYSKSSLKEMGNFAGWSFLMTSTSMVSQYGFSIVLNKFFGILINAAFGIANTLSGMLSNAHVLAQKAYCPVLVKSEGEGNRDKAIYISLFGCRISFYIFGIFAIPVILLMPDLLRIWLKDVPEWAVIFARLQLMRILLEQLFGGLNTAILATGKVKRYALCSSISFILPMIILPVLFKNGFAPYWLFIIWIFFWSICCNFIACHFAKVTLGILPSDYFRTVILPSVFITVVSIAPFLISYVLGAGQMTRYIMIIVEGVLFSLLGFVVLLNRQEKHIITAFIFKHESY